MSKADRIKQALMSIQQHNLTDIQQSVETAIQRTVDTETHEDSNTATQPTVEQETRQDSNTSNQQRKKATFFLDAELHKVLKVRAAQEGRSMLEIVEEALKQYLGI